ncbi:MAG: hypothetical protein IKQ70_00875 [Bacteroidales bacterium]|nr:hypothetical protein [Alphaproteobacteria bacterium]MBR6176417.1 hypothetical protein [Bacteroidales bacterium]
MTLLDIVDPSPCQNVSATTLIAIAAATAVVIALCAFFIHKYRKAH